MAILPALQKIIHLVVLSMSGIQSVCDKFVMGLIPVHCSKLKDTGTGSVYCPGRKPLVVPAGEPGLRDRD